ncbi:uncharacterized protein F4807DRAFT_453393 [Annulohypoxylon truncatum]|uniref:uncharacterized protein n=1 Tax=Annulohypoxylon truncatum TaxID=327061 RepID=UPI0020079C60|nr:uncharacterized protein F4807DRAFT_453393 [Annulohypoxylon truncatum]KAI1206424.1 hypothetical protein F4807DRAFT_453393 [Annulohypoxylon truncatum]
MVSSRKRALRDVEPDADTHETPKQEAPKELSLLQRIRNTWQFANLFQWIYLFGKVVKIDDSIDIDDLETECLKPRSAVLVNIGLALLKFVSSHRGLTADLFDEYTRRQYVAKAPDRNPFGTAETPAKFDDFDVFTKLKVLQQLTQWVMLHPERIREKMDEQKPSDQTEWRIEPSGWDSDDRTYYILDDNRIYRMTEAPPTPAPWKPKKNTKKAKAAARAAKRRRVSRSAAQNGSDADDGSASDADQPAEPEDDGLGNVKWECIATNLAEVQEFLGTIRKTRDENEKILRSTIENHLLPILEKQEESRKRKALQREKELLNLEKMAHAKRSSRLANKAEQQRLDQLAKEDEQKRRAEEAAAHKEEHKRMKMEKERDNRMMSRAQRLKERDIRRRQHEDELAQLSEDSKNLSTGTGRLSERRLKAEIEKNKQALQELEEEDDWIFDCICGVYGQVDDGTHSIACETCNIWQHSKCVGISEEEADRDDFHFICKSCRQKSLLRATTPKSPVIKLKVNQTNASSSPVKSDDSPAPEQAQLARRSGIVVELPNNSTQLSRPANDSQPESTTQPVIPIKQAGQPSAPLPSSPFTNGDGANPFSSPHPNLSPPEQSPNKARAYSTMFNPSSSPIPKSRSGDIKVPQKGVFHVSPKVNGSAQPTPSSSLPPHADAYVPPVAARSDSPLKQPFDAASHSLPVLSPPTVSFSAAARPPSSDASTQHAALTTPQLNKQGVRLDITPSLPPTQNGLSPLKRSPPPNQRSGGGPSSTPAPAILPPVTALSPSPAQQILTPPVKPADPARSTSHNSSGISGGG